MKFLVLFCFLIQLLSKSLAQIDHQNETLNSGRLILGQEIPLSEAPFHVSIQSSENHVCAGSIIGKRWILTSAHCVQKFVKTARGLYLN